MEKQPAVVHWRRMVIVVGITPSYLAGDLRHHNAYPAAYLSRRVSIFVAFQGRSATTPPTGGGEGVRDRPCDVC